MAEIWAALFIGLLVLLLALHMFTLPANWLILGLIAVWKLAHPGAFTWGEFLFWAALLGAAEVIELVLGIVGAKKYGASGRGNWGGILGSIAGAIFGAPFFLGLGALVGALTGAYLGCLLVERLHERPWPEARRAAKGALLGRFLGLSAKVAFGVAVIWLAVPRIWPG